MESPLQNSYEQLLGDLKDLRAKSTPPELKTEQCAQLTSIMRRLHHIKEPVDLACLKDYIKRQFSINKPVIDKQVEHGEYLAKRDREKKDLVTMTDLERSRAEELLKSENLFEVLASDVENSGLVDEKANSKVIGTSILSSQNKSKDEKPISVTVKGESAAGKNYQVDAVAKYFPPKWIINLGSITGRALFYLEESLSNKVIIIQETPGATGAEYSIRIMQSNGTLVLWTVEKIDGQLQTKKKEVAGPVGFISTTTRTRIHAENETRNFDIQTNETQEHTEAIHKWQLKCAQNPELTGQVDKRVNLWRNALSLLEFDVEVKIPFAELIEFPRNTIRLRRDLPKLLDVIKTSARLHQKIRKFENGFLLASVKDYGYAVEMLQESLNEAVRGCSSKCLKLVAWAEKWQADGNGDFMIIEAMKGLSCSKSTIEKALKEARAYEFIGYASDNMKGRDFKYAFIMAPSSLTCKLLTVEELEAKIQSKGNEPTI